MNNCLKLKRKDFRFRFIESKKMSSIKMGKYEWTWCFPVIKTDLVLLTL